MVLSLLALSAVALGSGQGVIADYEAHNGQITGCYSAADYRDALRTLRADEKLYGNAIEVIQEARSTNIARPGEPCEPAQTAPAAAVEDSSGSGMGIWIGLAAVVGVIAVGAGVWARRGDDDDGPNGGAGTTVAGSGPDGDGGSEDDPGSGQQPPR